MSSNFKGRLMAILSVAILSASLAGCVVVPERPYYGHYYHYYR